MKYDIRLLTLAADTLLKTVTNPLHRKILENYRRHAMLEVSGRYEEIFAPEMTVANPFYRVASADGLTELSGTEEVQDFYRSLIDTGTTVMLLEHENLVVDDNGFASEALYNTFLTAEAAEEAGHDVPDMDAKYIEQRWICMIWPYDEQGRMIGERVYPAPTANLVRCSDDDFVTLEEARVTFEPLLAEYGMPGTA